MISKTQIKKRKRKKTNPELVATIELAKKNNLLELGKKLSGPRRIYKKINLNEINRLEERKIIIIGKVLGSGDINKKIEISALGFSKKAKEELEKKGCKINTIKEELENNGNKLEAIKII